MTTERRLLLATLIACALVIAGCATLTPAQADGERSTRAFLEEAGRLYGLGRPGLVVGDQTPGIAAQYRRGTFYVWTRTLDASWRDALLAHEVGHWTLGHDTPLRAFDGPGRHAEQYARELAAHVKAVEVLVRVRGLTERQAVMAMHRWLMSVKTNVDATPGFVLPVGHEPPCRQIADVLTALPQHRDWTWSLPCSPWASAGHVAR